MKTLRCMMWKLFDPYGHSVDLSIGRKRLYDCFCLHGLYSFSLISKLITHNIKITLKSCFLKINVFFLFSNLKGELRCYMIDYEKLSWITWCENYSGHDIQSFCLIVCSFGFYICIHLVIWLILKFLLSSLFFFE